MMKPHFDIFDEVSEPFGTAQESQAFLTRACDRYNVLNLSYWFFGKSAELPDRVSWQSTYPRDFVANYLSEHTPQSDPIFRICLAGSQPLDWGAVRSGDKAVNSIHENAERYGVGKHGIAFPIRDPVSGEAMFSVNMGCEDRHWSNIRSELVGVFHLFAHYFHLRMRAVIEATPVSSKYDLSPREREVLLWAASGKTAWETASLLGVSESAIRLYTANAMSKLHAHTKTQAVAIAVRNGILN